jgi:transcription elongation factor Elf1
MTLKRYKVKIHCPVCGDDTVPSVCVRLVLRFGQPPACAFTCHTCKDRVEMTLTSEQVEGYLTARVPYEFNPETDEAMRNLMRDIKELS